MTSNLKRVDFVNKQLIPDKPGGQVADLENGYLRLANQIQDAVCKVELSGREFRVLNAVIRLTYGWSKKEDRITNSLIANKTGLAVKHVSEAVLTLAARRIILLRRIGQTRYIGINTELHRWAYGKPKCKSCVISYHQIIEENCYRIEITIPENKDGKKEPQTIPENRNNHPQKQGELSPKTGNTKDIIPNTLKTTTTPIVPTGDVQEESTPELDEMPSHPPEQTSSDSVRQVFNHWQSEHNHPTAKLDDKRRKRIHARLAQGFSVDELCKAITGAKFDTWLMGKNPSAKIYDGIDTLLRDAAQVEKLRDLADNEHARAIAKGQYTATTARNLENLKRWAGAKDTGAPF